jgi:hypothetical protein
MEYTAAFDALKVGGATHGVGQAGAGVGDGGRGSGDGSAAHARTRQGAREQAADGLP